MRFFEAMIINVIAMFILGAILGVAFALAEEKYKKNNKQSKSSK